MFFPFLIGLLVSGFVGWLAAYWFTAKVISGIVLKKDSLASGIGRFAAQHIRLDSLQDKLSDTGLLDTAMPTIEKHIDEFLEVKLKEEIPMIGMFIGNKTTDKLKAVFIKQLQALFPEIMQQLGGKLSASLNIEQLVSEKVKAMPDAELKELLQQPLQKPFTLLRWGGLLTGMLIATLNFLIFYYW
jgi:uncharacterized membrane protein YheB (UPF0754 family)